MMLIAGRLNLLATTFDTIDSALPGSNIPAGIDEIIVAVRTYNGDPTVVKDLLVVARALVLPGAVLNRIDLPIIWTLDVPSA